MTIQKNKTLSDLDENPLVQIASHLDLPSLSRWSRTAKCFRFLKWEAVRACVESQHLHRVREFKFIKSITIDYKEQSSSEKVAFQPKSVNLRSSLNYRAKTLTCLDPIPLHRIEILHARAHVIISPKTLPPSLKQIDLAYNRIRKLCSFSQLKHLHKLDLAQNRIRNIKALAALSKLRHLNLYDNQITDFSPLAGLTSLVYLNLSENRCYNLNFLKKLVNLEYLSLQNHKIAEATPFSHLVCLTYLDLSQNRINDIRELSGLKELTTLYLCHNPIWSINPLLELPQLANTRIGPNIRHTPTVFQVVGALRRNGVHVRMFLR